MNRKLRLALIILATVVVVITLACVIYVNNYYRATCNVEGTSDVKVTKIDVGYFFDGPGSEAALIFYPGGKVQDIAYAELLNAISARGVDCFLVTMPANLAMFGYKKASQVMSAYSYGSWYLGGHSLGGAFGSYYVADHVDEFEGIVLCASYSTKDFAGTDLRVLSMYGSNDKVLNMANYEKARALMPADFTEVVIEGGNHSQFGDYGVQKGDGVATISSADQKTLVADRVASFILGR